jgi:glycosyltransferase involved in cell wall biosynthesis
VSVPTISVIIPTYNAADYLPATLESVFAQSPPPLEIIVVDDGSSDDTPRLLESYGERVRVVRQANFGGPSRPRNVGVSAASGELIALFDSDDLMLPGKLAAAAAVFAAVPEVDLVFTDFRAIDQTGTVVTPRYLEGYRDFRAHLRDGGESCRGLISGPELYRQLLRANFIGTSSVVVRRTALVDAGGFDEELFNSDDRDMWYRLARGGRVFAFLDEPWHAYRRRPGSVTVNVVRRMPSVIRVLEKQRPHLSDPADVAYLEGAIRGAQTTYAWSLRRAGRCSEAAALYRRLLADRWSWHLWRGLWLARLGRLLPGGGA